MPFNLESTCYIGRIYHFTSTSSYIAEDKRFELLVPVGTIAFKAIAIDHSANPPLQAGLHSRACCNFMKEIKSNQDLSVAPQGFEPWTHGFLPL